MTGCTPEAWWRIYVSAGCFFVAGAALVVALWLVARAVQRG